jgi:hypothetical protein
MTGETYDMGHDFAPLRAYLAEHPTESGMPWEYMGNDADGRCVYRVRDYAITLRLEPVRIVPDTSSATGWREDTRPPRTTGEIVGDVARVWAREGSCMALVDGTPAEFGALSDLAGLLGEVIDSGDAYRLAGVLDELAGAFRYHGEKFETEIARAMREEWEAQ